MILKLLEMKVKALFLVTIAFAGLMILFYMKWTLDWMLGFTTKEQQPLHLSETVDETIAREMSQVSQGWTGPPAHPNIPVMLWWTPFTGDDGLQQCGDHSCFVTNDRRYRHHPMVKTIFFYGSDFKPHDVPLPRQKDEDWALFHEESPKNNPIFSHTAMIQQFNHTATFRIKSDLPLVTQYLEDVQMITESQFLIPLEVKNRMIEEEGLAPVAYVQSGCETPSMRDEWVTEFMKHIKVDSYGSCLHNKDLPREIQGSDKFKDRQYFNLLAKYKFVIAIENAVCDDYVTEKLWRTLQVGAIPIYLGAPNIHQYLPHSKAAILVKDFDSVAAVAEYVKMLDSDDAKYTDYMRHKQMYNSGDLVTNSLLVDLLEKRKWGVTSQQQFSMGNFVKHFQCLVCERVANNVWFGNLGFRGLPYDASTDHYGCPIPLSPLTGKVDPKNWYVDLWYRSLREAEVLDTFILENKPFNESTFYQRLQLHSRADR